MFNAIDSFKNLEQMEHTLEQMGLNADKLVFSLCKNGIQLMWCDYSFKLTLIYFKLRSIINT